MMQNNFCILLFQRSLFSFLFFVFCFLFFYFPIFGYMLSRALEGLLCIANGPGVSLGVELFHMTL